MLVRDEQQRLALSSRQEAPIDIWADKAKDVNESMRAS